MTSGKTLMLTAIIAAGAIVASPVQAQDERTTCASRPNKLQLLCSTDGCIRLEIARICETLRRAPIGKAKAVRTSAGNAPRYADLDQLIASID
jgi:hypothetical protein